MTKYHLKATAAYTMLIVSILTGASLVNGTMEVDDWSSLTKIYVEVHWIAILLSFIDMISKKEKP